MGIITSMCISHARRSYFSHMIRAVYCAATQVFDEHAQQHSQLACLGEYYEIGTVFNSPRACLRAETIARHVGFAAFSGVDLTALTFG
jgi:phosphoenolpyruvate synthase/pyruvate phosphate dikinase